MKKMVFFSVLAVVFVVNFPMSAQPPKFQLSAEELAARMGKAGDDPVSWLTLAGPAGEKMAREVILPRVHQLLLDKNQSLSPMQLHQFAQEFSQALSKGLRTPGEIEQVLGKPKAVSRQVLFRRSLEQWRYEHPLPLVLTFHHQKGQPPQLEMVQVWKSANP